MYSKNDLLRTQRILWEQWDPIGVKNDSNAFGEYDSYAPQILKFVKSNDKTGLIDLLLTIEKEEMGLEPNIKIAEKVAVALLQTRKD